MFFTASFYINLKRLLKPSSLLLIVLFCAMQIVAGFIQKELELKVSIGVTNYSQCELGERIVEELKKSPEISVIEYSNDNDMKEAILHGRIECGYILSSDLEKFIVNGTINKAARLYKTNTTISDGFTNELVFAALIKEVAPYIAYNYLRGHGNDVTINDTLLNVRQFYKEGNLLDFEISDVGNAKPVKDATIVSGVTAIYLFVLFFYVTIQGIDEKKCGHYEKLSFSNRLLYICSYSISNAVFLFIITSISAPYIGNNGLWHNMVCLIVYTFVLAALSTFGVIFIRTSDVYYAFFPFLSVAAVLLGGAFFDIEGFSPVLGKISYLFPTFYFTRFLY